ncbi:protein of unknown function [Evansella caseinilytica]|uniref:Transcobalamin-like C-terminal domain-containing protein n=1 Tax=Evansella caseinilytica TaxID=1503961 RepID=A0A1H3IT14_9BACI|nr:DUF4430 domain-containing protein [Evansella caseinilytica]SDY30004.1 protein of unknown function [Evansella caseinilytica]
MLKRTTNVFMSFLLLFAMLAGTFQTVVVAEEQAQQGTLTVIGPDDEELLAPTEYPYQSGQTAYDVLDSMASILDTDGQYGKFITTINGVEADDPYFWAFYVNGIEAQVGVDGYTVQDGDRLVFKYTDWTAPRSAATLTVTTPDEVIKEPGWPVAFLPEMEPTAFDFLLAIMGHENVEYSIHPQWGLSLDGISGIQAEDTYFWAFYVNGEQANVGSGSYLLAADDAIAFNYESWADEGNEDPPEENPGDSDSDDGSDDPNDNGNTDDEQPDTKYGEAEVQAAVDAATEYVYANGIGEWDAVALRQAGKSIPKSYLENVIAIVEAQEGTFRNITDTERYALGIVAAGGDPTDVAGFDLIEAIYNGSNVTRQGLNGVTFALIALDSQDFEVPESAEWPRERFIAQLLAAQNADGGWVWSNLTGTASSSDLDTTAMVLTALAPYESDGEVAAAMATAVTYLTDRMSTIDNSSTAAQVIIALSALEKDANQYTVGGGSTLVEYLLSFQNDDGGFSWLAGDESDSFSTDQAFRGIVAYLLFLQDSGSLYNFTETPPVTLPGDSDDDSEEGNTPTPKPDGTNDDDDDTDNEEPQQEEATEEDTELEEHLLPVTATTHYNLLAAGVVVLLLGMAVFVYERRKRVVN